MLDDGRGVMDTIVYLVTYEGYKPMAVDAFSKSEAAKLLKERLRSWGIEVKGKAKVEVM